MKIHWAIRGLYFSGLIVCLILGVVARLKMTATPIPDTDTGGYLFPAFDWLSGSGFVQHGRDWLYPAFITAVLKLSASLGVLVRIQQFLGLIAILVTSLAFYLHLHCSRHRSSVALTATSLLMLVPLYFISLGTNELWIESAIRPEAVCTFVFSFLFLGITLSSLALSSVLNRSFFVVGGVLTLGSSYTLLLLKPAWGLAFPLSFVPYFLFLFVRRFRTPSAYTLLYSLMFVVALHLFPLVLAFKSDRASKDFLPFTLVSIHAKQISTLERSEDEETTRFLADLTSTLRNTAPESDWNTLQFDGDFLLYKTSFFEQERLRLGLSPDRFRSLCYSVYFQTWLRRPGLMAVKVGNQLAAFLCNGQRFLCQNIDTDKARGLVRLACSNTPPSIPFDQSFVKRIYEGWIEQLNLSRDFKLPSLFLFREFGRILHSISLPLQLIVLFAALSSCVLVWHWVYHSGDSTDEAPANGRPLLSSAFVIATLTTLIYGCATTVAISHSFDVERYYITLGIPLSVLTVRSLSFLGELTFFKIRAAPGLH